MTKSFEYGKSLETRKRRICLSSRRKRRENDELAKVDFCSPTARDHSPAHPTRPSPLIARRTLSTMSATLVRASALGLGAGLPRRKTFTCGSDRVRAVSGVGTKKRTSSLRVVAEDTDWGRELSSAVVRVGAGVLMVHNGLDKLVDPEVRRDAGVHAAVEKGLFRDTVTLAVLPAPVLVGEFASIDGFGRKQYCKLSFEQVRLDSSGGGGRDSSSQPS